MKNAHVKVGASLWSADPARQSMVTEWGQRVHGYSPEDFGAAVAAMYVKISGRQAIDTAMHKAVFPKIALAAGRDVVLRADSTGRFSYLRSHPTRKL